MADQTQSLRILLVDDDEVDRRAVVRLLRKAGIQADVEEQSDRAGALSAAQAGQFDCTLLDYRLPGTDGVALLGDLRAAGMTTPVVALTGHGDQEVAVELMKAGAADYLNKNALTPERLERSLRYAMALHRVEEDRRLLLEREQQARLQAQTANRAKDEFLATLSHELRTPLNAILGWSQLLASGQLDEPTRRRAIEIIGRNTRLQAHLIDDLLDISRIVTGKLRLELRSVPVRTIVDSAIESALPAAENKGVSLVGRVADDIVAGSDTILCDPARMQQVIWNLLSNAIKFTPEGGRVRLSVERRGHAIVIKVTDTGGGIEPEFLPHVFDRFRQQDPGSTRKHGGLGLGLSIVRHLVELHAGSIEASSEGQGRGATFTVTVPVTPITSDDDLGDVPHRRVDAPGELPSLQGIHVLVVDNEEDARALVSAVLESCGARVTAVESAARAIDEIKARRPDVLLSDIAMPGEDGYSFIRRVRQMNGPEPQIPAAALTAYATATDRAHALLAGYQAHLPKPIEPAELTAVVATLARRTVIRS
jgi:signal transduction histidine kinase